MRNVLILGLVAVGIAGFGYFALFSTPAQHMAEEAKESADELSAESTKTPAVAEPREGTGTLEYLRLLGEDLECVILYEDTERQHTVEGTYFVSAGSMRGDFLTESPDLTGKVLSSMIIDGQDMYVWSDIEGQLYGMKVDLSLTANGVVDTHEPVALDKAVRYDCKPWPNVDRTVFTPPATVMFQDMSTLMQSGMEYGTVYDRETMMAPEF